MITNFQKIGLGGGCHWCTEAIFQSLKGVVKVEQGYIRGNKENAYFSEAVLVHFDPELILLNDLIEIHIYTHKSTSNHSFREKYRSAVYYFEENEKEIIYSILSTLQKEFNNVIITQAIAFQEFKSSRVELLDYYSRNPQKPFCKKYIHPKLEVLRKKYTELTTLT
ncbi:peptide-methionine (S)-S-oxide reductase [Aquimarina sp. MAR_2010_214]|uniref:peptide-methionine (S)-S-oxide reductase n=1 Tax=Aquimarina sp. MAR_2010_214 TaxID=1250026 RepID=UPI000C70DBA4|nr:peptide-methionine (S)-S-oxide reductase [Aquimarina sp. MAR_2010_214]PKV52534.1 peptide-methionine (S)-S-oxide reductase [Aquimarina sp. MAR_2010_214]